MRLFPKDRDLDLRPERVELPVRASDFQRPVAELEIRLDAFLSHHLHWRSRSSVQRLIKDGFVRVAPWAPERPAAAVAAAEERRPGLRLRHGARVVVRIPEALRPPPSPADPDGLVVLYEDEECLAVDKPPMLAVHPAGRHLVDTLIQRVHARHRREVEARGAREPFGPIRLCHRLDRETSGVLLVGKGERAHRELMRQFEEREVEKEYFALVHGVPEEQLGLIDDPLGPARGSRVRLKMTVRTDGMPSRTEWRIERRFGAHALLRCRPLTGRQHQIRVHLAAIGHPVVGDKLYGGDETVFLRAATGELTPDDERSLGLGRHALHAHGLRWRSVRQGALREAWSPLPEDLRRFCERL